MSLVAEGLVIAALSDSSVALALWWITVTRAPIICSCNDNYILMLYRFECQGFGANLWLPGPWTHRGGMRDRPAGRITGRMVEGHGHIAGQG